MFVRRALLSDLAYSSTLKMEEIHLFEKAIDFQQTKHDNISADRTLHNYLCENQKSCKVTGAKLDLYLPHTN
jgi:hypothetical protein